MVSKLERDFAGISTMHLRDNYRSAATRHFPQPPAPSRLFSLTLLELPTALTLPTFPSNPSLLRNFPDMFSQFACPPSRLHFPPSRHHRSYLLPSPPALCVSSPSFKAEFEVPVVLCLQVNCPNLPCCRLRDDGLSDERPPDADIKAGGMQRHDRMRMHN